MREKRPDPGHHQNLLSLVSRIEKSNKRISSRPQADTEKGALVRLIPQK